MRADIVKRDVEVPADVDCAPLGAAMLAAVAVGSFDTLGETARAIGNETRHLSARVEDAGAYDAAYGRYQALFRHLTPLFASGHSR
jgi:sugar (pentulose or hexulose) kinase